METKPISDFGFRISDSSSPPSPGGWRSPLVAFRVAFGSLLVVLVARYFVHGWIDAQFHDPAWFFPWPGLEWIRPWPRPWMHVHFAALGVLAACFAAGLFTRTSAALFCLGFTWVHLIDRSNYLNHYYLISLLTGLSAFLPMGRLDSFPSWGVGLLRFQVGAVYFFAGLAKLQGDWLLRAQPMRTWLFDLSDLPVAGPLLAQTWVAFAFSAAGAAFDLAIPFLLLWRRTRIPAFATLVLFHLATAVLFPIGLFPWIMIAAALVFLGRTESGAPSSRPRRWVVAAIAAYALVQVLVPLRFLLHPGDVLWEEAGFRFSWRVMLIEKAAEARFEAFEVDTGDRWEVRPETWLTAAQIRAMSTQPDMIRDFARKVRQDYEVRGRRVDVRAEVWATLNGRPARLLVPPSDSGVGTVSNNPGRSP